jgi:hypothetical protein
MIQDTTTPALPRGPTVGDTIWVGRTIAVPPGIVVRASPWSLSGSVELLGQPQVVITGDSATVRYPLVAWDPGGHVLDVPGPILIGPGGVEDTLASRQVTLLVSSVLPPGVPDSALPIQPGAGLVPRGERSVLPLVTLWAVAALFLVLVVWWRRRRRGEGPVTTTLVPSAAIPVERWTAAGEGRAVVAAAASSLRDRITALIPSAGPALELPALLELVRRERPDWPLVELGQLLAELEQARFAPGSPAAVDLDRRVREVGARLRTRKPA